MIMVITMIIIIIVIRMAIGIIITKIIMIIMVRISCTYQTLFICEKQIT